MSALLNSRVSSTSRRENEHSTHLNPKRGPLADSGQLRRLEMSPPEHGQVLLLLREPGQPLNDDGQLGEDDIASVAQEDEVGIVGHVAGSGAEVNDGSGGGAVQAKDVHVGHDVVATLLLLQGSFGHLGGVEVLQSGQWGFSSLVGVARRAGAQGERKRCAQGWPSSPR